MSLFGALTTGVSGINAQSRAIGNISDNLANTQTVGYKRVDTSFETLVTSSNARNHTPGGVIASPVFRNALQGTLIGTQSATDIAITGNGFFAVAENSTSANTIYSRRGDFQLDRNGFLVNGSGQFLRGWTVTNATANPPTVDTSTARIIQVDQTPQPAVATSSIDFAANLPANATAGPPAFTSTSTVQIFDSLGNVQNLNVTWTKNATANEWGYSIASPGGTAAGGFPLTGTVTFNTSGRNPAFTALSGGQTYTAGTGTLALGNINYAGSAPTAVSLVFGAAGANLTQFSDPQTQVSINSVSQNGNASGSFRDLTISDQGFVTANYSNGTQRSLFQIPLANFRAPQALQRQDGGGFAQTLDSGPPTLNASGRGGTGGLTASAVEGSNVDIADEFSKLIVTQRVFSANARVITTSDELLNEVVNLKR